MSQVRMVRGNHFQW